LFGHRREIALCDETLEARSKLLEKPEGEPSQVFDFNLGAFQKILGSVLYHYDPAKSGNREKRQPEHPTKIPHLPIIHFDVQRSTFGVRRSPFGVHRSAFTVHRSPFTVHRTTVHRSAL
jgi:hypothetical protein